MFFNDNEKNVLAENAISQIKEEFGQGAITTVEETKKSFVGTLGVIPHGKILEVSSDFAGKTAFLLFLIAEAQRSGGIVAYIDGKRALDPFYAEYVGIDVDALYVSKPSGFEQTASIVKKLIESGGFDLIVVEPCDDQREKLGEVLGELTDVVEATGSCVVFINRFDNEGDIRSENKKSGAKEGAEKKSKPVQNSAKRANKEYVFPPKTLLQPHVNPNFVNYVDNWDELKEVIEEKMKNYGVEAELVEATKGPSVTLLAIELKNNCSVNKLVSASKDLRRLLKTSNDIAIIPQLPDSGYCGIEVPNKVRGTVSFRDVICSREYGEAKGGILVPLGRTSTGEILIEDLATMPHALIAGTTGSGKSVCMNVIISGILCRYRPDEVKLVLIDLKQVEMGAYDGLPHMLFKNVLYDMHQIVNALTWIEKEVKDRLMLFRSLHVRSVDEYNKLEGVRPLPRIVVIIDEASELMTKQEVRETVEKTLSGLTRVARAAGVHLIFATQNPVKEVITNEIQNSFNTKIAFAVGDFNHSMVVLKAKGAECLLGNGDMYIKRGQKIQRGQCAFISIEETDAIVDYILENNEAYFDEEWIDRILSGRGIEDAEPDAEQEENAERAEEKSSKEGSGNPCGLSDAEVSAWQALKICYDSQSVSCSYLQRRMAKGYNTVANILEYWEAEGYVSKRKADKTRTLLKPAEEFYAKYRELFGDEED